MPEVYRPNERRVRHVAVGNMASWFQPEGSDSDDSMYVYVELCAYCMMYIARGLVVGYRKRS